MKTPPSFSYCRAERPLGSPAWVLACCCTGLDLRSTLVRRVLHQTLSEAPDPSWKAKLRKSLSRGSEAVPRVAQVDIGGAAVVLTSNEIYKDKFEVGLTPLFQSVDLLARRKKYRPLSPSLPCAH